jgi:hypothetical protein
MKTIKPVFDEFLEEQQVRLKPRTYGGYEDAIYLFEQCLNSYAYQCLDDKDSKLFDTLYNEKNKEFASYLGLIKLNPRKLVNSSIIS